jgi:predicted transcriptional regulator
VDFWMLTEKGKRFVVATERKHVENEAKVLGFLNRVSSATMEVIVQGTGLDEFTVRTTLKRLNEKSWVWKKTTRLAKF